MSNSDENLALRASQKLAAGAMNLGRHADDDVALRASQEVAARAMNPARRADEDVALRASQEVAARAMKPARRADEEFAARAMKPARRADEEFAARAMKPARRADEEFAARAMNPARRADEEFAARAMNPARRASAQVMIGSVAVGAGAPIVVQSMTNTDTADAGATANQVAQLARAGSELVRITVNTPEAAAQVPAIRERLDRMGVDVPLIGDFHYNGHRLLSEFPDCAQALAKYRINPGNVGQGKKRDQQFATMVELACKHSKPVRIGVNWGSLDQDLATRLMDQNAKLAQPKSAREVTREALIVSAIESARLAQRLGLGKNQIVISCKVSGVQDLIAVYGELAERCDYALHLGLTEAGMGSKGIVASTAALAVLLQQGIGDTLRISLTPEPNGDRTQEVIVAQEILQTMGFRSFAPMVVACPGCGRTSSSYFQQLAADIQAYLRAQMPVWRAQYPGVETMSVAVMGCVVNGPGESKQANIGISLPGTGESPVAPVFVDGQKTVTLRGDNIAREFQAIVDDYVRCNYGESDDAP